MHGQDRSESCLRMFEDKMRAALAFFNKPSPFEKAKDFLGFWHLGGK